MVSRKDIYDEMRAQASQIDAHERVLLSMRERQARLILEAHKAQMPARRIAEACRISRGRVYQLLHAQDVE